MALSWVGLAALSLLAPTPQGEPAAARIDGVWVLNVDESDDAREKLQEAMRERFRGRRGGPGGRGPGGGGLPGGGLPGGGGFPGGDRGMPNGGPDGGGRRGPEALLDGYDRLEITSAPDEVQISYGDDLRIYRPDGREVERQTARGRAKVKARWDEGRLLIETDGERMESREVFDLEAEPGRLVLTQVIDGRMGQVKIRRVYDRGEAEPEEPEPEPRDP